MCGNVCQGGLFAKVNCLKTIASWICRGVICVNGGLYLD